MEDNKGAAPRGNEWEVVSLTASAYAAAPGPREGEPKEDSTGYLNIENEAELSRALFMSRHFVFPPSEHENLPLEPGISEIQNEKGGNVVSDMVLKDGSRSGSKIGEGWASEGMIAPDEFPGIQFFDERGSRLTVHSSELEEGTTFQGLDGGSKEQNVYGEATFSSFRAETTSSGSTTLVASSDVPEVTESCESLNFAKDIAELPSHREGESAKESGLPCEAWWKRRAASFYAHAKDANAYWSVFVAATVMGLVILRQHWQQERWQTLQLKWQSSINSGNTARILGPIYRLKDVIVGGQRRLV